MKSLAHEQQLVVIERGGVTEWQEIFSVPDESTHLFFALHRRTAAQPDLWADKADLVTWTLEQRIRGAWVLLGSSSAAGDVHVLPDGAEAPLSWDETSLVYGRNRRVRVTLKAHAGPVDTRAVIVARSP